MENFEWRSRARCVAYAEQVCLAFAFPVSIVLFVLALVDGVEPSTDREKKTEEIVTEILFGEQDEGGMQLIYLLKEELIILLIVIGLYATLKLLRATALKVRDLKEVLKLCEFWRNVNLFFILIGIIKLFLFHSYVCFAIELVVVALLIVFLYVVIAFMREVKTVVNHVPVISGSDTI